MVELPTGSRVTTAVPGQFRIRLASPAAGEEEMDAIRRVLASGQLTNGPETAAFEREFAEYHEVQDGVAMANGTVALAAIYLALGIGPGDDVIVPSLTFVSSVTAIVHVGATPVFAEVDPMTYNLDPADVRQRVTVRTKAILAVHYGGQPAALDALADVAADAGVHLIEDAAQAHGATYQGRPVGGWGVAAMFSFTPTKNITTGEGGMVTTNDAGLAEQLRLLRNHGQSAHYRHVIVGWNWRLSEMQAAMGRVQLTRLRGIIDQKRANAAWMEERLRGVPGLHVPRVLAGASHVYMLYTVSVDRGRDTVLASMLAEGIEARVYFPLVHLQPIFEHLDVHLPVTEQVGEHILSIPFHSRLGVGGLDDVASALVSGLGALDNPKARQPSAGNRRIGHGR